MGAGAQIQRDLLGSFTGTIEAYDSGNVLLGSFNLKGESNHGADNSAIFMGILSDSTDIKKIVYRTDGGAQDFAINQLDLVPGTEKHVIPEPATMTLMGAGLLGLLAARRRKK